MGPRGGGNDGATGVGHGLRSPAAQVNGRRRRTDTDRRHGGGID
ncbi:MAG: hypothetical protein AVDCRST_MAG19-4550 [uncultured Thermomicrobiales bacterium]|uniref:Uncharacterized protein n=1 Tax=uncultured Thermomicrobiales bacterium TaxID=1645740 RepID=A0A6J4VUI5_9BACT|nr:MAG: hypothetical protein AVDCRST_MAG19-4550 [uncultured Thermomicrobiales bacterium]